MKQPSNRVLKILVYCLAAAVLIVSVVCVAVSLQHKNANQSGDAVQESLQQANESLQAARESEAASYEAQLSNQASAFSSEKDALNQTISDLNQQLSLKAAAAAGTSAVVTTAPSAAPLPSSTPNLSGKTVYLTFDDGPSPRTPEVLQILKNYGVKATFFVVNGGNSNHYMKQIVNEGHTIALHTYTHDYKTVYASEDAYFHDLNQISDLVYAQTGVRSKIVRFPGGSSNTVSRKYCPGIMTNLSKKLTEQGYTYYDWNVVSGDADRKPASAAAIVNNCCKVPHNDTVIILMHDSVTKRSTVEALPQVIEYYQKAGCTFAPITADTPAIHQRIAN